MHLEKVAYNTEHARCAHNARTHDKHSNENIDSSRTHLNYNLTENNGLSDMERFKQRLSELSYRKQKNNVRMEEIVITAPKNLTDSKDLEKFFKIAHKELQKQAGGAKNEVSCWIHLDEKSPHMHYLFTPGIEVNGIEKLSASKLFNRQKLQQLHPDMQKAIDTAFGHHKYIIVADDPRERHQTSDTLKAFKDKMKIIEECQKMTNSAINTMNAAMIEIEQLKLQKKSQSDKLNKEIRTFDNLLQNERKVAHNTLKKQSELDEIQQQLINIDNILQQKNTELDNIMQYLTEYGYKDKVTLDLMYQNEPEFVEYYQNLAQEHIEQEFSTQQNDDISL